MTDVYKVGVSVEMKNLMSAVLRTVIGDLRAANAQAIAFKATMNDLKIMGGIGLVSGMLGYGGVAVMKHWISAASEYQTALQKLQSMGVGDAMVDQADKFARGSAVMGASATDLMNSARDLTMVLGKSQGSLAIQLAPMMAQLNWSAGSLFKDKWSNTQELALMKVIEMKGGWQNAGEFGSQANMMTQIMSGTGGAVSPQDYLQFIKTAGVAGRLMSNEAFYYEMEPMIQELGGQRAGTGLMSAYNNLSQGRMTVRSARELMKLGLLNPKDVEYDKIGQIKSVHPGALKQNDLFTSDPGQWLQTVMIPALQAGGFKDQKSQLQEMGALFGNRTGSALYSLMLMQWEKIQKNMATTKGAMGVNDLVNLAQNNPTAAMEAFDKSLHNLAIAAGRVLLPIVIPAINLLTAGFNRMAVAMKEHPTLTAMVVRGFGLLTVALIGMAVAMPFMMLARFLQFATLFGTLGRGLALVLPLMGPVFGGLITLFTFLFTNPLSLTIMAIVGAFALLFELFRGLTSWLQGHPAVAKMFGMKTGNTPNIGAPPMQGPTMSGAVINMDGRKVGEIVSAHQAASTNSAPSSGNNFDIRQSPLWVGNAGAY